MRTGETSMIPPLVGSLFEPNLSLSLSTVLYCLSPSLIFLRLVRHVLLSPLTLTRVYAHLYYSHFNEIIKSHPGSEAYLNTCFKHYFCFIKVCSIFYICSSLIIFYSHFLYFLPPSSPFDFAGVQAC